MKNEKEMSVVHSCFAIEITSRAISFCRQTEHKNMFTSAGVMCHVLDGMCFRRYEYTYRGSDM